MHPPRIRLHRGLPQPARPLRAQEGKLERNREGHYQNGGAPPLRGGSWSSLETGEADQNHPGRVQEYTERALQSHSPNQKAAQTQR